MEQDRRRPVPVGQRRRQGPGQAHLSISLERVRDRFQSIARGAARAAEEHSNPRSEIECCSSEGSRRSGHSAIARRAGTEERPFPWPRFAVFFSFPLRVNETAAKLAWFLATLRVAPARPDRHLGHPPRPKPGRSRRPPMAFTDRRNGRRTIPSRARRWSPLEREPTRPPMGG